VSISSTFYEQLLQAAFTCADPKSAKNIDSLTVIFALLGSAGIKASIITLVKLTPEVNLTNIL